MIIKNLLEDLCSQKRIRSFLKRQFGLNLSGLVCLQLGKLGSSFFIPTVMLNLKNITFMSSTYFEPPLRRLLLLSTLILKLGIIMLNLLTIWMTKICCKFPYWFSCFVAWLHLTSVTRIRLWLLLQNGLQFLAKTGAWGSAMTPAPIIGNMESVPNVEDSIKQKTMMDASSSCRIGEEEQELVSRRVEEAEEGPRRFSSSTKRKVEDLIQGPRFRRRYVC